MACTNLGTIESAAISARPPHCCLQLYLGFNIVVFLSNLTRQLVVATVVQNVAKAIRALMSKTTSGVLVDAYLSKLIMLSDWGVMKLYLF